MSGIPDGWKLVPIEPTEKMSIAGYNASQGQARSNCFLKAYRAMLKAAPIAPVLVAQQETKPEAKP